MGCGSSKEESANIADLAPRVSSTAEKHRSHSPFADLSRETLELGLRQVAEYISKCQRHIRIVAVGGAVSTILLQSRHITHDIDFFAEGMATKDTKILLKAADFVRKRNPNLGFNADWIHNRTTCLIEPYLRQSLTREGFQQNVPLFQAPGLTIYAAPWPYAFASKLDRIQDGGYHAQDPNDAAMFLSCALHRQNLNGVSVAGVAELMGRYKLPKRNDDDLNSACKVVNNAYHQMFGSRPIGR